MPNKRWSLRTAKLAAVAYLSLVSGSVRPSNERHPGSERGLQRVCAPLRYVSSGAQQRAKRRKAAQSGAKRTSSRIKPDHHMLCRNFVCWLPKIGLLLRIFHAPRIKKGFYGYERLGAPSGKEVGEHARKKKKYITIWWPAVHQSCTQIQRFPSPFFRLWAPKPAAEPSPGLSKLRDTPRHSGAGPETPCFVSRLP